MTDLIQINGRFLSQPVTGVQRYALELFKHMDLLLDEPAFRHLRLVCLVPSNQADLPPWKNIAIRKVGINRGNLWEQLDLPFHARGGMLFSPANIGPWLHSRQAVTLHDASVFAVPEAYTRSFREKYMFIFKRLARTARLLLTDSVFSQRELARYLSLPLSRFSVIPLGGDHLNGIPADETILDRHSLPRKTYIFTVASQSLHKNFGRVLEVAARLGEGVQFVVAGGSYDRVFQQSGAQPVPANVKMLGYINDNELKALYENALAFIFPSRYEGFGLPVLEAMNCGCPVLCSNAASLPEVGGRAALYFDPLDVDGISALIKVVQADPDLQVVLRERGIEQASNFRWEKTARLTLAALASCL